MRWGLVPFWAKDIKIGWPTSMPKPKASTRGRRSARRFSGAADFAAYAIDAFDWLHHEGAHGLAVEVDPLVDPISDPVIACVGNEPA